MKIKGIFTSGTTQFRSIGCGVCFNIECVKTKYIKLGHFVALYIDSKWCIYVEYNNMILFKAISKTWTIFLIMSNI